MTAGWLLLLVVSFQSVDSQSTTDDNEVCDGVFDRELVNKLQKDVATLTRKLHQLQTVVNGLCMYSNILSTQNSTNLRQK